MKIQWLFLVIINFVIFTWADIKFTYRHDVYATHQPILYEIAINTTGPIIEFGCGNGSTDLLHEICKKTGRLLISLDDDQMWLNKFAKKYLNDGYREDNSGWHKFYFVPGKKDNLDPGHWIKFLEETTWLYELTFAVCFIDQSPWLGRYETIKRLKDRSVYIILHDCDFFPTHHIFGKVIKPIKQRDIPGVFDFSDMFKSFKVYFPPSPWPGFTGPPTLVASDFEVSFPKIDYSHY